MKKFNKLKIVQMIAFIFLFLDFRLDSALRRENEELNYAFYTDPDTGVANRNSCDVFTEQYAGRLLPDGMAAITLILEWKTYDAADRNTMVMGEEWTLTKDPRKAQREAFNVRPNGEK